MASHLHASLGTDAAPAAFARPAVYNPWIKSRLPVTATGEILAKVAIVLQRRVVSIGHEGFYYLFVMAFIMGGAALRDVNLLFVLAGLMVGPLLLNWRIVVQAVRQLDVERRLPKHVFAGQSVLVQIRGHNRRRRLGSWMLVVEDALQGEEPEFATHQPPPKVRSRVLLPYVAAGSSSSTAYRLQVPRRGGYRFDPLQVRTGFPLGLVKAALRQLQGERLIVYPQLGRLTSGWTQVIQSTRFGQQQTFQRQGPIDGDYYGLREWRPGDSRRWIHWRTTAKLGHLAVRQFEQLQNRDLALVLDLWQPEQPLEEDGARVERAISLAATMVEELCRLGSSRLMIGLAAEQNGHWEAAASAMLAEQTLERLALARSHHANRLEDTLRSLIEQAPPHVQVVVISPRSSRLAEVSQSPVFAGRTRQQRRLLQAIWLNVNSAEVNNVFQLDVG